MSPSDKKKLQQAIALLEQITDQDDAVLEMYLKDGNDALVRAFARTERKKTTLKVKGVPFGR